MRTLLSVVVALAATAACVASPASAAQGGLDSAFAGSGRVTTAIAPGTGSDTASALLVLPSGQLVAGGYSNMGATTNEDFSLVRLNDDGGVDSAFGSSGAVTTPIAPGNLRDELLGLALQPDGMIVAAGWTEISAGGQRNFALARYTQSGALDTGFSGDGTQTTSIGTGGAYANGLALQSTGKIVAAGTAVSAATGLDFALDRYDTAGELDSGFGTAGKVLTPITAGSGSDFGNAVAIGPADKIVVAGSTDAGANGNEIAVARYTADGLLDPAFSGDGIVTTEVAPGAASDAATSVLVGSDGSILVGGLADAGSPSGYDFVLVRYDSDGNLDTTFGTGGIVTTPVSTSTDQVNALAVQFNGKIVAAGTSGSKVAVVRYLTNGTPDSGFGTGGIVTTDATAGTDTAQAVKIDAGGRIVTAGSGTGATTGPDYLFTRYIGDPPPPASPAATPPAATPAGTEPPQSPGGATATPSGAGALKAGACANVRRGTAHGDRLIGTPAGDLLQGLSGNDTLLGGAGADCLVGGKGNDRLNGGKGRDSFDGGPGADRIDSADGVRETIRCGPGKDRVVADKADRLRGCERVRRRA